MSALSSLEKNLITPKIHEEFNCLDQKTMILFFKLSAMISDTKEGKEISQVFNSIHEEKKPQDAEKYHQWLKAHIDSIILPEAVSLAKRLAKDYPQHLENVTSWL